MDELIKQVTAKAGISEEQARSAVNTVLDFVKGRLPAPIAGQIDNAMSGEGGGIGGTLGDMASKAGGLLG
ncbi:MAG TPA: hypothetical protein VMZ30_03445 [Pyrinomonadaceae bacterium]|nr:hypothetical protein [Pyrinomonadaceae bacterium]